MDPFAIFGVPRAFTIELTALERTHRDLSRALHPDKFVGASPTERRTALERSASVNAAFRTLRDPVTRAEALFASLGIDVGDGHEPAPRPDLLMHMLEAREALAEARTSRDVARMKALHADMDARRAVVERQLAEGFSDANLAREHARTLVPLLGELRFYRRFLEQVALSEDEVLES